MAKNAYARTLLKAKDDAYTEGVWEGVQLCLNIVAIAPNHTYGFGEKRLSRLEGEVQKLFDELVDTNDPLVNKAHIEQAVRQIRGKAWVE